MKLNIFSEGRLVDQSGIYPISLSYENENYIVTYNSATYTLTGHYYVHYTLPNGVNHIEEVEEGKKPVGITDDIYKVSALNKLVYSEDLNGDGFDLHVVVTKKSYLWVVIIVPTISSFFIIYWFMTRKQRRNRVS